MIFQPLSSSLRRLTMAISAILIAGLAPALVAEPVLDLTLDDPSGLIKAKPDGISALSPEFSKPTATIASGPGGRAVPTIEAGQAGVDRTPPSLKILSDPSLGSFLQLKLGAASSAKAIGVSFLPASGGTSLSAIYKSGTLDGGFDLFFRMQKDNLESPLRLVFHSRLGPYEIGMKPDPKQEGFGISFINREPTLQGADVKMGPKPSVFGKIVNPIPFESGEIYHLAILFQTATDGTISVKVFLSKGVGEIHPDASASLNTVLEFKITKPAGDSPVVDKPTLVLSAQDCAQTLDVAAFRVFAPAPKVFPALVIKK